MKAKFNKKLNIEIQIESIDDLKVFGLENCEDLSKINFSIEPSDDGDRTPVGFTNSKYPSGVFLIVEE